MLKVCPPLVPLGVTTVIWLLVVEIYPAILNTAVNCVELSTVTFVTRMPWALEPTVV